MRSRVGHVHRISLLLPHRPLLTPLHIIHSWSVELTTSRLWTSADALHLLVHYTYYLEVGYVRINLNKSSWSCHGRSWSTWHLIYTLDHEHEMYLVSILRCPLQYVNWKRTPITENSSKVTCWHVDIGDMLTRWHVDMLTCWQGDMLTRWHFDKMTCWHAK